MPSYLSAVLAFIITITSISMLRRLATRIGLVDMPGGRKSHSGNIPLIGGVSIFLGFSFSLLTFNFSLAEFRPLLAASLLIVFAGLLDDFHELSAKQKLVAQMLAAMLLVFWGKTEIITLGNLLFRGDINLYQMSYIFSIFALVGLMNALNMADGMDGLAGSLVLVQFIILFVYSFLNHLFLEMHILLTVIGSICAFLIFNFPYRRCLRNKIFLGDAGSMFLGLLLGWFAIRLSQAPIQVIKPITILWILILPLFDTITAIIRRVRKGRSPFHADKAHLHNIFLRAGFTPFETLLIMLFLSILASGFGVLADYLHFPSGYMFLGLIGLFSLHQYAMNHAWKLMRLLRKRRTKLAVMAAVL